MFAHISGFLFDFIVFAQYFEQKLNKKHLTTFISCATMCKNKQNGGFDYENEKSAVLRENSTRRILIPHSYHTIFEQPFFENDYCCETHIATNMKYRSQQGIISPYQAVKNSHNRFEK